MADYKKIGDFVIIGDNGKYHADFYVKDCSLSDMDVFENNADYTLKTLKCHDAFYQNLLNNQELLVAVLDSTSEEKARKLLMEQLDANTAILALAGAS